MKIIVTGGAGFIASHIVDAYIKAGHKVVIIDNLSTGFRKNINSKAKFVYADIRDRKTIEKIFKKERPAIVNHHAALASVIQSMRDPASILDVNVLGTANVALAFSKYGDVQQGRFIFASTGGAMYGAPKKLPADERESKTPLSTYGLSKALGEEIIGFYSVQFKFDTVIFRYANVYGPRQNPKGEAGVCAIFTNLMGQNKRPTIFGNGRKSRDYIYVEDIVKANVAALKKGANESFNLGTGILTTDLEVFKTIAEAKRFSEKPIYAPLRPGELYKISLDAAKARRILGWKPETSFRDGVRRI